MAKTATTLILLFVLFTFSDARIPSDLPRDDVIHRDLPDSLPESEIKPVLLLPSEKFHPDPASVVASEVSEPETADPKSVAIDSPDDLPVSETEAVNSIPVTRPLTIVTFRPVNRRIHLKRSYPFRLSHRGCHHHRQFRRFGEREVSYGNDMILSSEMSDFDPTVYHGRVRQIPSRWIGSHHHRHHHHDLKHNLKRWFHHDEDEEIEKREKEHGGEREGGGFVKRIRKFLNHF